MYKIKKLILLMFIPTLSLSLPSPVLAHTLVTDNNIGAVMHIDPDDDPVAGSPANFFFEFKDKQNRFDPSKCSCVAAIYQQGQKIFSQSLFQDNSSPSLSNSSFSYTFPDKDVYELKVTGSPINGASFQSFALTYDIRVSRVSGDPNKSVYQQIADFMGGHVIHVGVIVTLLGFIVFAIVKKKNLTSANAQ